MHFESPLYLVLLLGLLPIVMVYHRRRYFIRYPAIAMMKSLPPSGSVRLRHLGVTLRCLGILGLVLALARPQRTSDSQERQSEGLDVVLILDTSRSMEARDFVLNGTRPSRLEVIKQVITDFITARPGDRIGLVVFGTEAFTQAPLTLDHDVLMRFLQRVQIGMAGDATAIGDGLATAVNRLRPVESKSKIAILLTDGGNNAGRIDPLAAADAAKIKGVTIYTIGVGSKGDANANGQNFDVDEPLMREISQKTGGQYYQATNTETLVKVYETIDKLEKTKAKIQTFHQYEEVFDGFATLALIALALELLFNISPLRMVP